MLLPRFKSDRSNTLDNAFHHKYHWNLQLRLIRLILDVTKAFLCLIALLESAVLLANGSLQVRKPSTSQLSRCVGTCNTGTCIDSTCVCPPGWTGAQCDVCFGRIRKNGTARGIITDGPTDYHPSAKCIWIIENGDNSGSLVLKLNEFFTECCWDHLYVYDGDSVYDAQIAAFSGSLAGTEVVAKSGKAIIYFISDLAFNLPGFNITYEYYMCPYNCNNHGKCQWNGVCECDRGFTGEYCAQQVCLMEMNNEHGPCKFQARCQDGRCGCNKHTHGYYCQDLLLNPVLDQLIPASGKNTSVFYGRASHKAVLVGDRIWLYGGMTFNDIQTPPELITYEFGAQEFRTVISTDVTETPLPRYDHSMVFYNQQLYVFGGVLNKSVITNEMWSFHVKTRRWRLLAAHSDSPLTVPLAVSGHTAHVISDEMFVFFGYNSFEAYVFRVQIYSFETGKWRLGDIDPSIIGRFGHSSVCYYESDKNPMVLIYGGYGAPLNGYSYSISDELLLYDPTEQTWTSLGVTGVPLFRHSAVVIDGIMLIFGGNGHNETSKLRQNDCYSNQLLAFDIDCREWLKISLQDPLRLMNRYGHAAVSNEDNMFVVGGFSGVLRNDVLKFTPAECNNQATSAEECESTANGIRCVFVNKTCKKAQLNTSYRQPFLSFIKTENPRLKVDCASKRSRLSTCVEAKECHHCVQKGCGWCESTQTCLGSDAGCADGLLTDRRKCGGKPQREHNLRAQSRAVQRPCALATNCFACRQLRHCSWFTIESKHICVSLVDEAILLEEHNRLQTERLAALPSLPSSSGSVASPGGTVASAALTFGGNGGGGMPNPSGFGPSLPSLSGGVLSRHFISTTSELGTNGGGTTPALPTSNIISSSLLPNNVVMLPSLLADGNDEIRHHHHSHQSHQRMDEMSASVGSNNQHQQNMTCPMPCFLYNVCQTCVQAQCMWCPSTRSCVPMDTYMINFPYGQCQSWVTAANRQHACQLDPYDCEVQKTCAECQTVGPRCGWCDDGSGTGLGRCMPGAMSGSRDGEQCAANRWYFVGEPPCQCNGHSNCGIVGGVGDNQTTFGIVAGGNQSVSTVMTTTAISGGVQKCQRCADRTRGERCEQCEHGFYGDPRNGGTCHECQCNGQATLCNQETGDCHCFTKGVTGAHCDRCEPKYIGDPVNNRPCTYELVIDFIFTFKLDGEDAKDKYVNQINFLSVPFKRDTDVQFSITCELSEARVSINLSTIVLEGRPPHTKQLMAGQLCGGGAGIKRTYSAADPGYAFGTDANTTFYVRVYDFVTPVKIVISFAQSPPINWVLFFVIFAACFIVLLVVAGLLWMIKLRVEWYRNIRRRHEEIEEMASRPFASVQLQLGTSDAHAAAGSDSAIPTPVSVEPCSNYQSGVYTIIIRLPTGGRAYTPYGTSGLAVGSALCHLTNAQLALLQPPDADSHRPPGGARNGRKSVLSRWIPALMPHRRRRARHDRGGSPPSTR